jgi:hypothetical protein
MMQPTFVEEIPFAAMLERIHQHRPHFYYTMLYDTGTIRSAA